MVGTGASDLGGGEKRKAERVDSEHLPGRGERGEDLGAICRPVERGYGRLRPRGLGHARHVQGEGGSCARFESDLI